MSEKSLDASVTKAQVFLSYAREDREEVEKVYQQLSTAGFKPWMDTMDILPGEVWMESIRSAIEKSDFFLACISSKSINKRGILQKEFKFALDVWQGMFESDIYLIPVRLEECTVPDSMLKFQWVDMFKSDGFSRLKKSIIKGMELRSKAFTTTVQDPVSSVEINDRGAGQPFTIPKKSSFRIAWIIIGLALIAAVLPWINNNYFYHEKRPAIPATCQSSLTPVRVAVAQITNCSTNIQNQLDEKWSSEFVDVAKVDQSFKTSDTARKLTGYDVIVWGSCETPSDAEMADLSFELTTSRKPYEIYEDSTLPVQDSIVVLAAIGDALFKYQHGDYLDAATAFNGIPSVPESLNLSLFQANSWLFAGHYETAIDSYKEIIRTIDPDSAKTYNNLGVALLNTEQPTQEKPYNYQGLNEFDQAVKLATDRKENDIKLLALVNRSYVYRQGNSFVEALSDCNDALIIDDQSALPHLCLASYNFSMYSKPGSFVVFYLREINQHLSAAEVSRDAPALTHYMRATWHLEHFWMQKREALDEYMSFLSSMENRACLIKDHDRVDEAIRIIDARLTVP